MEASQFPGWRIVHWHRQGHQVPGIWMLLLWTFPKIHPWKWLMKPRQSSVSKGTTRKETHRHGSFGPGRSLPDDFKYVFPLKLHIQSEKLILFFPFSSWDNWVLGRTSSNYAADKWLSQTRTLFFLSSHCHPHCPWLYAEAPAQVETAPNTVTWPCWSPKMPQRHHLWGVLSLWSYQSRGTGQAEQALLWFSGLDPHWAPLSSRSNLLIQILSWPACLFSRPPHSIATSFLKAFLRFSQAWSRTVHQSTSLI